MKAENLEDLYELSPLQQGILFHHLLTPETGVYIEQLIFVFRGDFRADLFRRAWQRLVRRHAIFRTSFYWENLDKPLQVVHREVEFPWQEHDWRQVPAAEQDVRLQAFLDADRARGFDLAQAPLMKMDVFRMADDLWKFTWGFSHLIQDGWSFGMVTQEWIQSYKDEYHGRVREVPTPPPYKHYISHVRRQDRSAAERFWRRELGDYSAPISLRIGRPPGAGAGISTHSLIEAPMPEMVAPIEAFVRRHQLTVSTILQCAWVLLLHRYSGQRDVVFGSTVSGRGPQIPGSERMIGVLITTIPTRMDADPEADLLPWLKDFQVSQARCREYQYAPLIELQAWADVGPDQQLFDSIALLENVPLPEISFDEEKFELLSATYDGRPHYSMTVEVFPPPLMPLRVIFNCRRYDLPAVWRIHRHIKNLMWAMIRDPHRRLKDLPLMAEQERRQVVFEWNDTAAEYPRDACLHQLFAAQAARTPDEVAVVSERGQLSYGELDRRSNRLAHRLRELGVGPEVVVGILMGRSPDLPVALMGVLKAGGAYLPLDPTYPAERLELILEDGEAAVLLTEERWRQRLSPTTARVLCLDREWPEIAARTADSPGVEIAAEHLAYAIFTSGSTGRPKGVLISHRGAVNTLCDVNRRFAVATGDRVLALSSLAFDLSVYDLFGPLAVGGAVVLPELGTRPDPAHWLDLACRHRVTLWNSVPALMELFVEHARGESQAPPLRLALLSGDWIPLTLPERIRELAEGVKVISLGGATEGSIWSILRPIGEIDPSWDSIPYGRPMRNQRFHVLDWQLRPSPVGVAGDLYIAGDGVARGYCNRPRLTAEQYPPDSFAGEPGAHMYRTGDLGRHHHDGEIEFLGRADNQVKIRGFRIELGEIESVLGQCSGVQEAVVLALADAAGGQRLVAYYTPANGQPPAAGELRRSLRVKLPDYMLPSAFVSLPSFPLTANGKVDRKALAKLDTGGGHRETAYAAPRTPLEEVVAGVWQDVLGVEQVGVDDSFIELGGHSLLATQVITRLRTALGIGLPLRAIFETPTVAELAANIERRRRQGRLPEAPPIVPLAGAGERPLSFAQERLWFLDQLHPGTSAYNVPFALRITSPLRPPVLARVMSEIVRRHENLRTTFPMAESRPVQVIAPAAPAAMALVDLGGLDAADREAEAGRLRVAAAGQVFDLARGPLMRLRLLRLAAEDHILLGTMHHIVSDGWSQGVLMRELLALYQAFAAGRSSPLPELPVQYADFAHWQRGWLTGEVLESELEYWRQKLHGAPPVLDLPTDHPRPALMSFRGRRLSLPLREQLSAGLAALSRKEGATFFMVLLAAFQAFLRRITGQADLNIGSPIAGRGRLEIEGLVGFFANTVVLRGELSDDPSFRTLLQRARDLVLEADANQDLPFEKLVQELDPERSLSYTPLFQVMLVLRRMPREIAETAALRVRPLATEAQSEKFDLTLTMIEEEERWTASFRYNTDLFEAVTIQRMLTHFARLLAGAVAEPGRQVSRLPLLSAAERCQLVGEWNDTRVAEPPRPVALHQPFETWAERAPEATAVVFENAVLTYGELAAEADRLAHRLGELGVGREARVAICLERSPAMVVALLGVLKAGGAYVPLDPEYPGERLAFMLADSRARVLLAAPGLGQSLDSAAAHRVDLGSSWRLTARRPRRRPPRGGGDDLAYVIYTSGSTGEPKGVGVSHRAIANHLDWRRQAYPLGAGDRFLQKASFSFDISVWEIFAPLASGATLVLAGPGGHQDSAYLARLIAGHRITDAHFGPAMLRLLLEEPGIAAGHGLRRLFCGGEVLSRELEERARERLGAELHYLYGPTEATVDATFWRGRARRDRAVPIGRPIANTTTHLLDRHLEPVAIGVRGELHIGGDGTARGYLDRRRQTAEHFVPDPLVSEPGGRLYRSGDLARRLSDGAIEFLGRIDHQIKLRGFRVELGEIEAVLARHPAVAESAVLLASVAGDSRLAAFVVRRQESDAAAELRDSLRDFLRQRLPEHMMPASLDEVAALPRTASGKLDRGALARQASTAVKAARGTYAAPRTPTEELVAEIWREVLGVERVGVHDHFFDLGGHSLLAIQVSSRLRARLATELPLRAIFEAPTVARLAARLAEFRAAAEGPAAPPLVRLARDLRLPLSFAQERLWFLEQLEPDTATYNIPFGLRFTRAREHPIVERAVSEIIRRHENLRTTFRQVAGEPCQVIAEPAPVALPLIDLGGLPAARREAEARRLATADGRRPFDLTRGPLLRVALLRLAGGEHRLFGTMHHIVSDGWSLGIFLRELAALCEAFSRGRPSNLPELEIQYADFAHWQRQWLRGEALAVQLGYWRRRLGASPPVLELPTDRPRPAVQSSRGARLDLALPDRLARDLHAFSQAEDATLFMTLLAAFQTLLHRYSGQTEIGVGAPVAGRTRLEVEGLIGFFVNTLVLRADLAGDPSFRALVGRVREAVLEADAHQDIPFEKVVQELQPERSLSHAPLFQVMLAFQAVPQEVTALPGLRMSPLATDTATEKFDLTLTLVEEGGRLGGGLSFNTDIFDATTMGRMLVAFETLLAAAVADPDRRLSRLRLLPAAARHQILVQWNDTRAEQPPGAGIHQLFEARVERVPEAVAVVCDQRRLTFRELNARANRLAHHLRELGVGPEVRVAICMARSPEMVEAILAVLKAGGAYVPLDPAYPQERLRFLLADTGARVVLSQRELADRVPAGGIRVVCPRASRDAIDRRPGHNPASGVSANNLAYLIYTSGSTGKPKGVALEHRGTLALVHWARRVFPPEDRSGVLFSTTTSFDVSVFELFVPLSWGGKMIVAQSALALAELAAAPEVRMVTTPPSVAAEVLRLGAIPRSARTVGLAGEPLGTALTRQLYAHEPIRRVYDLYGPSEDTTYSTFTLRRPEGPAIIGRPIANTRTYVLDRGLRPVPAGVPGELCLAGAGQARGYLNRAGRTAEQFPPDAFGGRPGGRLYRTGDLARHLPDGNLEFLGRIDFQVQLGGIRIELGEVEAALLRHPAVQETAVLAHEGAAGGLTLVAYVVLEGGATPGADELRAFVGEKLPGYMVPASIVRLPALPRTPSGKLDRVELRRVPVLDGARPELADAFVAPRTPTEEALAGIWKEVLEAERIGVHDGFFELGGHSLLATRVVSRVRAELAVELPVRAVFEMPTVAAMAESVDRLRRAEVELAAPPISPSPRGAVAPLSFAQERLWFLEQLHPGTSTYNVPFAYRLRGCLQVSALERALNEVVRRHQALRTVFEAVDGTPSQRILPAAPLPAGLTDLSALSAADREAVARRLARDEGRRLFDLEAGPLLRFGLLRLGPEDHLLLGTMHHIVSDGWSLGILLRELSALYQAFCERRLSPLPELPVQYADFALWQRRWLQGEPLEAQMDYWRKQLSGAPPVLELPLDRPRPPIQTYRASRQRLELEAGLSRDLIALSQSQGSTLFMTLLAAFQALLARTARQTDVSLGSPIAGRNRVEIEELIGFFVNTVVLRGDLADDPSFQVLLRRARDVVLEANAHQDLPFEKLVQELQPQRSLSYTPLFQVMLTHQTVPPGGGTLGELRVSPLRTGTGMEKFDLTLAMIEDSDRLEAELDYNRDLFDATTMRRLLRRFATLLAAVAADPAQRISRIPLLRPAQRAQLLTEWNDTRTRSAPPPALHGFFEAQAARTPTAPAVVFEDETTSYRQLNERANRLAHYLRALGVGPEVRVAICMGRSLDLVVAILAVLKAGGAYVPLDPDYPRERLAFILEDGRAAVLLTEEQWRQRLPDPAARVVALDRSWPEIETFSAADPRVPVNGRHLAYVIYTSGSTGVPKGVAIEHHSPAVLVSWALRAFTPEELAGVLFSTSVCFDLSIYELFVPLSCGGQVILAQNALAVAGSASSEQVTLFNSVPSVMAELLRVDGLPDSVRTVNLAGEPLAASLVKELYDTGTVARVCDLYGPSEDTTYSTFARRSGEAAATIGRPIADTRVYLLDARLEPVPLGTVGELYIGGEGLARGYLDRRSRTAEPFLPDAFGTEPGARLYRTGDLARFFADGSLEFLGRGDHQVKLRGLRIELGEIEAALRRLRAVEEAVVTVREDDPGKARLVAYVVSPTDPAELRARLGERLPGYMVPSAFVTLKAMPRLPNGKIDRRALPAPAGGGEAAGREPDAPRNALEITLAEIWEEVLETSPIGIHDNFFDLGGHSLLAVRLMARIRQQLGVDLPVSRLFEGSTLAGLAELLRTSPSSQPRPTLVQMRPGDPGRRPLFCVHPVGGGVLCYMELARELSPGQPVYGLQVPDRGGPGPAFPDLESMAAHYAEAIRRVQPAGGYLLTGWSLGGLIAYEIARQLDRDGQTVDLLALVDSRTPGQAGFAASADESAMVTGFALDLAGLAGRDLSGLLAQAQAGLLAQARAGLLAQARAADRSPSLDEVLGWAQQQGVISPGLEVEELERLFALFKANREAAANYVPGPYPGRVILFKADQSLWPEDEDPTFGWGPLAAGVEVSTLPGNHYTLMRPPRVRTFAERLTERLAAGTVGAVATGEATGAA